MKFSKKLLKGHQVHCENAILSNLIINCYYYYILPLLSSEYIKVVNQTLYDEIVDSFFPKELRNPKIEMDFYLCRFTLPNKTCCRCTKTCKYYGKRLLTFEIKKECKFIINNSFFSQQIL